MPLRYVPLLILAFGALIVGWGIWNEWRHPPRLMATGEIAVDNAPGARPERLTLATRKIAVGAVVREEVRLPGGSWIDCAGDCGRAVRVGLTHVFEEQQRRGR